MNVILRGCCCDILDSSDDVAESRPSFCWGDFSVDLASVSSLAYMLKSNIRIQLIDVL